MHRLKNANPAKQEQARLEVENAEDDLVQKTEVAITLMKTVLENVRHFSLLYGVDSDPPCFYSRNLSRTSTNLQRPNLSTSHLPPRLCLPFKVRLKSSAWLRRANTGKQNRFTESADILS